eukprot:879500-Rhodomonas_salina.2
MVRMVVRVRLRVRMGVMVWSNHQRPEKKPRRKKEETRERKMERQKQITQKKREKKEEKKTLAALAKEKESSVARRRGRVHSVCQHSSTRRSTDPSPQSVARFSHATLTMAATTCNIARHTFISTARNRGCARRRVADCALLASFRRQHGPPRLPQPTLRRQLWPRKHWY